MTDDTHTDGDTGHTNEDTGHTDEDTGHTDSNSRRAEIETVHDSDAVAALVAAAVRPDNTDAMETTTDGDVVRTTIERGTTGGLGSSVDDYVVNVGVAQRVHTNTDT